MKRWIAVMILLVVFLMGLCMLPALAQEGAEAAFAAAYPGHVMTAFDQWEPTAAAVMEKGEEKVLCVAEKENGAWRVVIANPHALLEYEGTPKLFLDCDTALFWSYGSGDMSVEFSCFREEAGWGHVASVGRYTYSLGSHETHYAYRNGKMHIEHISCDENDNILSREEYMPIAGAWMEEGLLLASYDAQKAPNGYYGAYGYIGQYAIEQMALELYPDCTFVSGAADRDALRLILRKPNGERVFVGVTWDEEILAYRCAESTPIPSSFECGVGYENFENALWLKP